MLSIHFILIQFINIYIYSHNLALKYLYNIWVHICIHIYIYMHIYILYPFYRYKEIEE